MDGELAELQKKLVSFQIYVFHSNCYHFHLFRPPNTDKDISSVSIDFRYAKKKMLFWGFPLFDRSSFT